MSDYTGGPDDPQRGQGGYSQPTSGPAYGQPAYGQPTSGPAYGQPSPVYPSQASPGSPHQQPTYPVSGYPGYPQAHPGYPPGYGAAQFDAYGRPLSDKSRVVAGVLGITLGGFGAGRFYTGHTGMAVAQLVVTLVTCGIGHFWGMIDGIMLLTGDSTDAQGRVLRS